MTEEAAVPLNRWLDGREGRSEAAQTEKCVSTAGS